LVGGDGERRLRVRVMVRVDKGVGRLIQVVVRADAVPVGDLRKKLYVFQVGSADIDVEENQISVLLLLSHKVPELRLDVQKGLRQALSGGYAIDGQVDCRDTCP